MEAWCSLPDGKHQVKDSQDRGEREWLLYVQAQHWMCGWLEIRLEGMEPNVTTLAIGRKKHPRKLHIVCCYALTFAATRVEKDRFYDDLHHVLYGMEDKV